MNDLLYSIKAIRPSNPPFTFDDLAKGFDKGVWTSEKQSVQTLLSKAKREEKQEEKRDEK